MAHPQMVYLTGEPELIGEYGALLSQAGCRVMGRARPHAGARTLRSVVKRSATIPRSVSVAVELTNTDVDTKRKNLVFLDAKLPTGALLLTSSVTVAAHEQASWIRHPERLIGFGALPSFAGRKLVELAPCVQTSRESLARAADLFAFLRKEVAVIQDRVGMITPRVVCAIINEACFAVGENVASPSEIDTAMRLGTNYPAGPIEWGNAIGFHQVCAVLEALHRDLGDDRYRIAPVLRQLASGRRWWGI